MLFQITLAPSKFPRCQGETKNEQNCSLLSVGIKRGSREREREREREKEKEKEKEREREREREIMRGYE